MRGPGRGNGRKYHQLQPGQDLDGSMHELDDVTGYDVETGPARPAAPPSFREFYIYDEFKTAIAVLDRKGTRQKGECRVPMPPSDVNGRSQVGSYRVSAHG